MAPDRLSRIKSIFDRAAKLDGPDRDRFLDSACGQDAEVRREVESLLAFHTPPEDPPIRPQPPGEQGGDEQTWLVTRPSRRGADGAGEAPPVSSGGEPEPTGHDPAEIGQYRIVRRLGAGGMGVVYKAIQAYPRRTVALKVINRDFGHPQAVERFRFETQVLAKLQHPAIAQLYDAGVADVDGRSIPYFAMELVRGRSLSEYLRVNTPSLRERLTLMQRITQAVHHAHSKGVVHRDLKPANVIVSESGDPKILDFGVARSTDSDVRATNLQTKFGQFVGTVPYMSPEQVSGDPDDVDARSDVYSLGVMLYEMLAGELPYKVDQRMIVEAVRVICEDEPSSLSSISRVYRGDVETIVSKSLAKQRSRRYQSANELADDIERFLRDEPIVARPPSVFYQLQKFSRRHRAISYGVLAASGAFIVSSVLVVAMWRQAENARANERDQREIAEARSLELEAANDRIADEAGQKSEVIDQLRSVLGVFAELESDIQRLTGATAARARFASASIEALDAAVPVLRDQPWAIERLAETALRVGRLSLVTDAGTIAAIRSLDRAAELFEQLRERDGVDPGYLAGHIEANVSLGLAMLRSDQPTLGRRRIEIARRDLEDAELGGAADTSERLLRTRALLDQAEAHIALRDGKWESAAAFAQASIAGWRELIATEDTAEHRDGVVSGLLLLAKAAERSGDHAAARARYAEALSAQRRTVRDHPGDLPSSILLADALLRYGDYQETAAGGGNDDASLAKLRERLVIIEDGIRADPAFDRFRVMRLDTLGSIAQILARKGDIETARIGIQGFLEAAESRRSLDPADSYATRKVAVARWCSAQLDSRELGQHGLTEERARSLRERAIRGFRDAESTFAWLLSTDPNAVEVLRDLAAVRLELADAIFSGWLSDGRPPDLADGVRSALLDAAETSFSLRDSAGFRPIEADRTARTLRNAATVAIMLGMYEEAVDGFVRADAISELQTPSIFRRQAIAYAGLGDAETALAYWRRALAEDGIDPGAADDQGVLDAITDSAARYLLEMNE